MAFAHASSENNINNQVVSSVECKHHAKTQQEAVWEAPVCRLVYLNQRCSVLAQLWNHYTSAFSFIWLLSLKIVYFFHYKVDNFMNQVLLDQVKIACKAFSKTDCSPWFYLHNLSHFLIHLLRQFINSKSWMCPKYASIKSKNKITSLSWSYCRKREILLYSKYYFF